MKIADEVKQSCRRTYLSTYNISVVKICEITPWNNSKWLTLSK